MAIQTFTAAQVLTAAQMNALQANDYNQTVSTKTASYTLVAADKGTRIAMNSASATNITVNTSLFSAGDSLFLQNIGSGTATVLAGTATVSTSGSLALAQYGGGTLYFTSAGVAIFFSGAGSAYGTATGGIGAPTSVTINSVNYQYLTFNSTGTLTVTKSGFFDYLAVGGGTGNNNEAGFSGGGGGSGALVIGSFYLSANATVTIGAGSATAAIITTQRTAGDTTINAPSPFAVVAVGSQSVGQGNAQITGFVAGGAGAGAGSTTQIGLSNIAAGYRGGKSDGNNAAGGGGGFLAVGGNGVSASSLGGAGGAGFDVSVFIGGSSLFKASGGGSGGATTGGAGGSSLGNNGTATTTPVSGGANTGCGGGGGLGVTSTGLGGSGICYIRYKV